MKPKRKERKSTETAAVQPAKPVPGAPETVLLAVTGMSPAVLTETVWALAHEEPPVIPHRVSVVTTIAGRQAIERDLHQPTTPATATDPAGPSVWDQLRALILGPGFASDPRLMFEPIRLITAPNPRHGRMDWLEDIRTPDENRAAAEFILDQVRGITANDDTRLVASLAGGRKTMGALLYAAMSLLGRKQDRLTHVLVSDPFDQPGLRPRFYAPSLPAAEFRLRMPDGTERVVQENAKLHLADVPFVPLRYLFRDQLGRFPGGFMELVGTASDLVSELSQPVSISFDRRAQTYIVDGTPMPLTGRDRAFFEFLCQRARSGQQPFATHHDLVAPFGEFLRDWAPKHPDVNIESTSGDWRKKAPESDDFRKRLNSIRDHLREAGLGHLIPALVPVRGPVGFQPDRVILDK